MSFRVVLVSGSLRQGSYNSAAIRAVQKMLSGLPETVETEVLPIGDFPYFNEDVEKQGYPPVVAEARAAVLGASAVIISTPAYNGAPPGVLKNALDWLSRPDGDSPLTGRPVAVLSASPGAGGAGNSQAQLKGLLAYCDAAVVDHPDVVLGSAGQLFDERGELTDARVIGELRSLVSATLSAAEKAAESDVKTPM
jgi:chromate reductase